VNRRETVKWLIAGALVLLATLMFISLASYDPHDQPWGDYPYNRMPRNWCGLFGAMFAGAMHVLFGHVSILSALVPLPIAFALMKRRSIAQGLIESGGVIVLTASLSVLLAVCAAGSTSAARLGLGGALGYRVGTSLVAYIGGVGAILFAFALVVAAAYIANERATFWVLSRAWAVLVASVVTLKELATGKRRVSRPSLSPFSVLDADEDSGREEDVSRGEPRVQLRRARSEKEEEPEPASESPGESTATAKRDKSDEKPTAEQAVEAGDKHEDEEGKSAPVPVAYDTMTPLEEPLASGSESDNLDERDGSVAAKVSGPVKPPKSKKDPRGKASKIAKLPPMDLLDEPEPFDHSKYEEHVGRDARVLERTLREFGIDVRVVEIRKGPVVTQYEIEIAPGVKVGKIVSLSDDLARAMKAHSVRVVAPIPGKSTVGVEVPNPFRDVVRLKELLLHADNRVRKMALPLFLGKDVAGAPLIYDLTQMPHLLIAGATGSGKSICINSIILSILMMHTPDRVKMLLVDPKMVELSVFKDIPHLISPVVTDMKKAAAVLEWAVKKMDERYALLSRAGVRDLPRYNKLGEAELRKRLEIESDEEADDVPFYLPYVVIMVDEFADLMMVAKKDVENAITRLSQKSRAVGIHLVLATQRPSVDVITGLIKANLPARISFQVSQKVDSRTILDRNGAEKLLGSGDMLFLPPTTSKLIRAQGTFVSEDERHRVTDFVREQGEPEYNKELVQWRSTDTGNLADRDPLYEEAIRVVLEEQRGSVSLLQRRLGIGYSRAARLIDLMAEDGIVGDYKGSQAREVILTLEEWEELRAKAFEL